MKRGNCTTELEAGVHMLMYAAHEQTLILCSKKNIPMVRNDETKCLLIN